MKNLSYPLVFSTFTLRIENKVPRMAPIVCMELLIVMNSFQYSCSTNLSVFALFPFRIY